MEKLTVEELDVTTRDKKVFFSFKENSNYKVLMTYDRSEVIEYEQFSKLIRKINEDDKQFVTINQRIVKTSTIIDISPTDELTENQRTERKRNGAEGYQDLYIKDDDGNIVLLKDFVDKIKSK